jgi:hypothetical protein
MPPSTPQASKLEFRLFGKDESRISHLISCSLVADTKLSILLAVLVPVLSVLVGLLADCCVCFGRYRRRHAAQQKLKEVKQVVNMVTLLKRAIRRRELHADAQDAGEGAGSAVQDNQGGIGGGWLGRTVSAVVGIRRLGRKHTMIAAVVNEGGQNSATTRDTNSEDQLPEEREAVPPPAEHLHALPVNNGGEAAIITAADPVDWGSGPGAGTAVAWGDGNTIAIRSEEFRSADELDQATSFKSVKQFSPSQEMVVDLASPRSAVDVSKACDTSETDFIAPNAAETRQT